MNSFYKLLILLLFTGWTNFAKSQIYPVGASVQLQPPYSVHLPDYVSVSNPRLMVILTQRDLSQASYQLNLKMEIALNGKVIMRTSPTYRPAAITLSPGTPTIISGADLSPYLDSRNIDFIGYSRSQYEKTKSLPEGYYTISFTSYDYRRAEVQISATASTYVYLARSKPPLLNTPICGTKIPYKLPQFLVFQWTPMNLGSANSAFNTEYVFELYEVLIKGRNINDIVQSTRPIYRTTVQTTQLVYGATETTLRDDTEYVWRVQSKDKSGKDLFDNNGFSEVCSFYYGGPYAGAIINIPIQNFKVSPAETAAHFSWDVDPVYDAYKVHYRLPGKDEEGKDYPWYTKTSTTGEVSAKGVQAGTEYECRMQGFKGEQSGVFSEIVKFKTKAHQIVECPQEIPTIDLSNPPPALAAAHVGMTFKYNYMEMTVTKITALGDGWYAGEGYIPVQFLGNMNMPVRFEKIWIGEDMRVYQGLAYSIDEVVDVGGTVDDVKKAIEKLSNKIDEAISQLKKPKKNKEELERFAETIYPDFKAILAKLPDMPEEEKQEILDRANKIKEFTLLAANGNSEAVQQASEEALKASNTLTELANTLNSKAEAAEAAKTMAADLESIENSLEGEALVNYLNEIKYLEGQGLIPENWWKTGKIDPFVAGFIDGLAETIIGVGNAGKYTVLRITALGSIITPPAYYGKTPATIAAKHAGKMDESLRLLMSNPKMIPAVYQELKKQFGIWFKETAGLDKKAQYNQGKLMFDVAMLLVGVEELKALAKAGKFSEKASNRIKNLIDEIPIVKREKLLDAKLYFTKVANSNFDNIISSFKKETGIILKKITDEDLLKKIKTWQGQGEYLGVDEWIIVEIPMGTKLYGGLPGQSAFYTPFNSLTDVNYNKIKFWKKLQVSPHPEKGLRGKLGEYEVRKNIKVGFSKAIANPKFGEGGGWQFFVDEYSNDLKFIKEIDLK